jgi:hypothetical protein
MSDSNDGTVSRDDLARLRGEPLPDREAMSLVSPDPTLGDTAAGMLAQTDAGPAAGAAALATQTGDSVPVDAAASGEASESITDEDRSESWSRSDSASAG